MNDFLRHHDDKRKIAKPEYSQPYLIAVSMYATSEQFSYNLSMSDGLLDDALDVFWLDSSIPNAFPS